MPLSRKYRPQSFKDVTGQQHITETLRKEVESGMLGHAFLFSGPRGVGKTTTARIFAKALLNPETNKGEPPLDSEASAEIDRGNCIDFIEIDAASHTGVDHVREVIIDHVRFAPARWKRKVYVIDECHMLSTSAWNALLKTLEEPPEYAFFILATTELHKVPETIKSRCQRFEFKRIQPRDLAERVILLAKEEGLEIEDAVVQRVVHASDGCLRDAESLLDQLISLGAKKITADLATLVLPASMLPRISALLRIASSRNISETLANARTLMSEGMSALEIIQDLLAAVRTLITAQQADELSRLQQGDESDRALAALSGVFSLGELSEMALMLLERRRDCKMGTDPAFALELSLSAIAGGLLPSVRVSEASQDHRPRTAVIPQEPSRPGFSKVEPHVEDRRPAVKEMPRDNLAQEPEIQASEIREVEEAPVLQSKEFVSSVEVSSTVAIPEGRATFSNSDEQSFDIHDIRKYWGIIIREVEKTNHSIPFILKVSQPDRIEGVTIHIRFQYPFHRQKLLEDLKTRRVVEEAIRTVMKNQRILIDGFCGGTIDEGGSRLEHAPADVVSRVLGAFGGQVVE